MQCFLLTKAHFSKSVTVAEQTGWLTCWSGSQCFGASRVLSILLPRARNTDSQAGSSGLFTLRSGLCKCNHKPGRREPTQVVAITRRSRTLLPWLLQLAIIKSWSIFFHLLPYLLSPLTTEYFEANLSCHNISSSLVLYVSLVTVRSRGLFWAGKSGKEMELLSELFHAGSSYMLSGWEASKGVSYLESQHTCMKWIGINFLGSIRGLGRSPGGGYGNPLQNSSLENPHGQRKESGGLSSMGSQRVGQDWATQHSTAEE